MKKKVEAKRVLLFIQHSIVRGGVEEEINHYAKAIQCKTSSNS
jgi:hypothetical protein